MCFEIVSRPLDREPRPRRTDQISGRFLACASGFHDPAVYRQAREVTVVGTLEPSVVRKIGEHDYRYPQVSVENIYLWPERVPRDVYYAPWPEPFWYPGWCGPYGPYGPWSHDPYWWGPWIWWGPPLVEPIPHPPARHGASHCAR